MQKSIYQADRRRSHCILAWIPWFDSSISCSCLPSTEKSVSREGLSHREETGPRGSLANTNTKRAKHRMPYLSIDFQQPFSSVILFKLSICFFQFHSTKEKMVNSCQQLNQEGWLQDIPGQMKSFLSLVYLADRDFTSRKQEISSKFTVENCGRFTTLKTKAERYKGILSTQLESLPGTSD